MPEAKKKSIDVEATLGQLHQAKAFDHLDTAGLDAGPLGRVHPIGWTAFGLLAVAIVFHIKGSDWLIGNFSWWQWVGLVALAAVSLRPEAIKAVSRFIDRVTDFLEKGSNSCAHPWATFATMITGFGLAALLIGPLQSLADWIFGVTIEPEGTSDFIVTSSTGAGVVRTTIAAIVVVAALIAAYRLFHRTLPAGEISIMTGGRLSVFTFVVTFVVVWVFHSWEMGVTTGFAISILVTAVAVGPLWVMAWGIFVVIFFYVVTRYTARFIEADIIVGEVNSLGLQLFGLLALLGVGYGVKAGVNPRIDFWWADFSNRTKAWLDFTLHALLFVPFLWAALRLLHSYAKTNLGYKTDFSGETDGSWPASWHVWETWSNAADAGNLPVGPVRAMIFVGFGLFLAQIISEMIKDGFVLIRREDLAELKHVDAPTRIE